MDIIGTCINCWQPSATFAVNAFFGVALLGIAMWRTA